jgi:membrane protease YdiL (CAAX protease family)
MNDFFMNVFDGLIDEALIAILVFLFMYLTYYFSDHIPFLRSRFENSLQPSTFTGHRIYTKRVIGFVLLGIVPLLVIVIGFQRSIVDFGLGFPTHPQLGWWGLIPTIVIIGGSLLRKTKAIDINYYPEVKITHWTRREKIINAWYWFLYLLGYEIGLRGFLFFALLGSFSLIQAVIINSVIYSLIHIFKGPKEAFGAFFLGVLFCFITYFTQSIWIASFIHVAMAVINDLQAIAIKAKTSKSI